MKHLLIKKNILKIILIAFAGVFFQSMALAADPVLGEIKLVSPINLPKVNDLASLIELLVNILKYLSWAIAPVLYVYAAFQIMASGGDPKKVQDGYKTIIWTTVGLVVLLVASSLPNLIKSLLGVS